MTRAEISLRDQKRENEAVDAAMAEYRRLVPHAPAGSHDADLAVSGQVNRMIAAAIYTDPRWFWEGPDV